MTDHTMALAAETMLDALLPIVDGRADDDLIFMDPVFAVLADRLRLQITWVPSEPMTAGEFRARWRRAKGKLAAGGVIG